jgi:hypothetical protein
MRLPPLYFYTARPGFNHDTTSTAVKFAMATQMPPSDNPLDSLSGTVERVTFHSEATGFCVLRVKARCHRDLVTVVVG